MADTMAFLDDKVLLTVGLRRQHIKDDGVRLQHGRPV